MVDIDGNARMTLSVSQSRFKRVRSIFNFQMIKLNSKTIHVGYVNERHSHSRERTLIVGRRVKEQELIFMVLVIVFMLAEWVTC
jgi:hypothetical protein